MKVSIKGLEAFKKLDTKSKKVFKECITEYTYDLHRVATLRTPKDEGNLETSGTKKVSGNGSKVVGQVSFKAINRGFNYAYKMHEGNYNLGQQSMSKSGKGVRSKYSNKTFKVGRKYLEDTAIACEDGYKKDLRTKIVNNLRG